VVPDTFCTPKEAEDAAMFGAIDPTDPESLAKFRAYAIPLVDQQLRGTIAMIWTALPPERRNLIEVEKEFRRLVDRTIDNLRADASAFGLPME
jgi:hypothetical protein